MNDYGEILLKLKSSKFRSKFKLKESDIDYINKKGFDIIKAHAYDFISKRLVPANPINDGKQTPMKGHPVFIAQHATATCCRTCLFKWHKISMNKTLNEKEINFIVGLIMAWIEKQIEEHTN